MEPMELIMPLIFSAIFSLYAEYYDITSPSQEHLELEKHDKYNITDTLNDIIAHIMDKRKMQGGGEISNSTGSLTTHNVEFSNGMYFNNVTTSFQISPLVKIGVELYDNKTVQTTCEMIIVWIKAHQGSNSYVSTEEIPLNFTLHSSSILRGQSRIKNPLDINYHDLDKYNFKLYTTDYQLTPSQVDQLRQEFRTHLKSVLQENLNTAWKNLWYSLLYNGEFELGWKSIIIKKYADFLENEHKYYYLGGNISTDNFSLNNVVVKGLWNFNGVKMNFSNPANSTRIQSKDVVATMMYKSSSGIEKFLEISTKYIYTSFDMKRALISVRAEGFSVKDIKTNTSLVEDQANVIVNKFQSSIVASIKKRLPHFDDY